MDRKALKMKRKLFLDKREYLQLLEKQKTFVSNKENKIIELEDYIEKEKQSYIKELRRYENILLKLQKENNEFRAFKKGRIWAYLTKWRHFKSKILGPLLKSLPENKIVK